MYALFPPLHGWFKLAASCSSLASLVISHLLCLSIGPVVAPAHIAQRSTCVRKNDDDDDDVDDGHGGDCGDHYDDDDDDDDDDGDGDG